MGLATALLTDKDLLFPCFLYVYYLEFFCRKDLSLLFHVFIYPSIYFYQDGLMDICFFLWIITQYSAIYLVIQIVPLWPLEDLLDWLRSPSDIAHLFFFKHTHTQTHILNFWHYKIVPRSSCVFPAQPLKRIFKELWTRFLSTFSEVMLITYTLRVLYRIFLFPKGKNEMFCVITGGMHILCSIFKMQSSLRFPGNFLSQ